MSRKQRGYQPTGEEVVCNFILHWAGVPDVDIASFSMKHRPNIKRSASTISSQRHSHAKAEARSKSRQRYKTDRVPRPTGRMIPFGVGPDQNITKDTRFDLGSIPMPMLKDLERIVGRHHIQLHSVTQGVSKPKAVLSPPKKSESNTEKKAPSFKQKMIDLGFRNFWVNPQNGRLEME